MNSLRFSAMVFFALLFFCPVSGAFAHGGGHEPKQDAAMDSMYSVKEGDTAPLADDGSLDNIFSPTDLFTAEELVDPMPDMKMNEHAGHQGPQVEISRHKLVSPDNKGFGVAVGITLFAGLVFAGLTFMRSGE
jgi:hypothetical protein